MSFRLGWATQKDPFKEGGKEKEEGKERMKERGKNEGASSFGWNKRLGLGCGDCLSAQRKLVHRPQNCTKKERQEPLGSYCGLPRSTCCL